MKHHRPELLRRGERGSALLAGVFVLTFVTALGTALLFLTQTEQRMSVADNRSKQVFYVAEAGLEDGRASLFDLNGEDSFDDDLEAAAGVNGRFDADPDAIQPLLDIDGQVVGFTGFGDDVPLRGATPFGDGWYAAFLANDAREAGSLTDDNNRVQVMGVGVLPRRASEVVEAVLLKRDLFPVMPPATITLLGPAPDFDSANSSVKDYSGDDCGGVGPGGNVPVVGTIGPEAEADAEQGMHDNPDYTSGSYSDEDVFADLTDLDEPTLTERIDGFWTDCNSLWDLVEDAREVADRLCTGHVSCSGGGSECPCDPDSTSPGDVTFIDGDYSISGNQSGHGLLVVTGRLELAGTVDWNGLILVLGDGDYQLNGGGSGVVSGGMVVADIAGPDGSYGRACEAGGARCWSDLDCPNGRRCVDNNDNCTGGDDGFGNARFDESGGGNGGTVYCSTDLDASNPPRPYEVLAFRQR